MPWIPDVAPRTIISAANYGNVVRDRVVHVFDNVAQRNSQAVPKSGMHCYCIAEQTEYRHDGTGWVIIDEPWQVQAAPFLKGSAATANGPDWQLQASPPIQQHYRLVAGSTRCEYKRSRDMVEFVGAYAFQDGAAPGTPAQDIYAALPVASTFPVTFQAGAGGGYGSQAWGQYGGPVYLLSGLWLGIVRAGSTQLVGITSGPPNFPWPNDSFYVSVRYRSAVNYG